MLLFLTWRAMINCHLGLDSVYILPSFQHLITLQQPCTRIVLEGKRKVLVLACSRGNMTGCLQIPEKLLRVEVDGMCRLHFFRFQSKWMLLAHFNSFFLDVGSMSWICFFLRFDPCVITMLYSNVEKDAFLEFNSTLIFLAIDKWVFVTRRTWLLLRNVSFCVTCFKSNIKATSGVFITWHGLLHFQMGEFCMSLWCMSVLCVLAWRIILN